MPRDSSVPVTKKNQYCHVVSPPIPNPLGKTISSQWKGNSITYINHEKSYIVSAYSGKIESRKGPNLTPQHIKTKELNNIILNTENKYIIVLFFNYLGKPKKHISLKNSIPVLLRKKKIKVSFWTLVFRIKDPLKFDSEFQKLVIALAESSSKKQLFELINFGINIRKYRNSST